MGVSLVVVMEVLSRSSSLWIGKIPSGLRWVVLALSLLSALPSACFHSARPLLMCLQCLRLGGLLGPKKQRSTQRGSCAQLHRRTDSPSDDGLQQPHQTRTCRTVKLSRSKSPNFPTGSERLHGVVYASMVQEIADKSGATRHLLRGTTGLCWD